MAQKPHVIYLPQAMKVNRVTGNGVQATVHEGETLWPEYAAYEARFDPPVEIGAGFVVVEWSSPTTATIREASPDEIAAARALPHSYPLDRPGRFVDTP